MQLIQGDLFKDFPTLKFIVLHGGGAAAFHWSRYRGIAQQLRKPPLSEHLLKNVFFDTCVYDVNGMDYHVRTIPADNLVFASEMIGAVQGIDPETGYHFDDTKRHLDRLNLDETVKEKPFSGNARRVFGGLDNVMKTGGSSDAANCDPADNRFITRAASAALPCRPCRQPAAARTRGWLLVV